MDNSINWCNKLLEYEPDNFCKNNIDEYYTKDTLSIYYDIFNSSKYSTLFYFSIPFLEIMCYNSIRYILLGYDERLIFERWTSKMPFWRFISPHLHP